MLQTHDPKSDCSLTASANAFYEMMHTSMTLPVYTGYMSKALATAITILSNWQQI